MSPELHSLADEIRVCVGKAENYYATVGVKLREARELCRAEGRCFNAWCKELNVGLTMRRVRQLIGPDPIAQARREAKHKAALEIGKPFPIEQPAPVEGPELQPARTMRAAAAQSISGLMVGSLLPPGPSRPVELPQQPANPATTNSSDADAAIAEYQRAQVVWALSSYRVGIAADGVLAWYCRQNAAKRQSLLDRLQTFELSQCQPTTPEGIAIGGAFQLLLDSAAAHCSTSEQ